jgi:hypothetical protein
MIGEIFKISVKPSIIRSIFREILIFWQDSHKNVCSHIVFVVRDCIFTIFNNLFLTNINFTLKKFTGKLQKKCFDYHRYDAFPTENSKIKNWEIWRHFREINRLNLSQPTHFHIPPLCDASHFRQQHLTRVMGARFDT